MGFDINATRILVKCRALGVDFSKVATLGRQGLHISEKDLQNVLDSNGLGVRAADVLQARGGYAESLLAALGAKHVDSIDASAYEAASIVHDMNTPIPEGMKGRYSLVIDGGTLEHVFNFPTAIKNCLELVKQGGFFIGITPANNFFGHGFYQFSPELYFRVFSAENGYEVTKMLFYGDTRNACVYEVSDPNVVASRVNLTNSLPSYLFVIARRAEQRPLFLQAPYQSDYENISWQMAKSSSKTWDESLSQLLKNLLPSSVRQFASRTRTYLLAISRPTGSGKSIFFKKTDL